MPRSFSQFFPSKVGAAHSEIRRWLQIAAAVLVVLNAVAFYLYVAPPGGTRRELTRQSEQLRNEIASEKVRATKLKTVSAKVQLGGNESAEFERKYVFPKRLAYGAVIAEIQRMAKASGLQERDAVYNEEPIEGSADLTLLNSTANYEGTYENLKKFLYEVDHSPMLIMLENITASPQQKGNQINASIRFQAVIRDDGTQITRGQP
ncbi:MAG: type 4a pilus biogenesis protein PilO [Bryobacteraceae bacterium]